MWEVEAAFIARDFAGYGHLPQPVSHDHGCSRQEEAGVQ